MAFKWLKSILPKGLYGRAALILIAPVVTIQLVVSVVFIQRHFEGVTRQLTTNVALELDYFLTRINSAENATNALRAVREMSGPLGYIVTPLDDSAMEVANLWAFGDLTAGNVVAELRARVPEIRVIDLQSLDRTVILHVDTALGPYRILFERSRVSASNPHQLLVLMIATSFIITLISFIFFRNQVRPIRRLAKAADAFGKGNRIDYHVSGATEVRQAGLAFIEMRNRIERQIEQRTLMLSGVSHDLRTPLTRLKLGLSLGEDSDDTRALIRDVDDMEEMLDEFLAFSRGDSLETAQRSLVGALLTQVAENTKRLDQGVELITDSLPDPDLTLTIREAAMTRALENLVTNALRYGSRARLSMEVSPKEVAFVIEDDGPGIALSDRENAKRPFVRLVEARNQNLGTGVGLGLAIATDIASSHGGALDLEDSTDLGGLRAVLRLPR